MQIKNNSAAMTSDNKTEPAVLLQRIGSTTFLIEVHFSDTSTETMGDKVLRLIEREAREIA